MLRVSCVSHLAGLVLGNSNLAHQWLVQEAWGLGRRVPRCVASTPDGFLHLVDFLYRIDHGVYC